MSMLQIKCLDVNALRCIELIQHVIDNLLFLFYLGKFVEVVVSIVLLCSVDVIVCGPPLNGGFGYSSPKDDVCLYAV